MKLNGLDIAGACRVALYHRMSPVRVSRSRSPATRWRPAGGLGDSFHRRYPWRRLRAAYLDGVPAFHQHVMACSHGEQQHASSRTCRSRSCASTGRRRPGRDAVMWCLHAGLCIHERPAAAHRREVRRPALHALQVLARGPYLLPVRPRAEEGAASSTFPRRGTSTHPRSKCCRDRDALDPPAPAREAERRRTYRRGQTGGCRHSSRRRAGIRARQAAPARGGVSAAGRTSFEQPAEGLGQPTARRSGAAHPLVLCLPGAWNARCQRFVIREVHGRWRWA